MNVILRRIALVFSVLLALLFIGCEGGQSRDSIYILENDYLVNAQDYHYYLEASETEAVIRIVSWGVTRFEVLYRTGKDLNASMEIYQDGSGRTIYDEQMIPFEDKEDNFKQIMRAVPRYIEDIKITSAENHSLTPRRIKVRVYTKGENGHIADITIIQSGRS